MKISGTVTYLSFEGGAYGIIDDSGKEYLPVNMPEQLKKDGARIVCDITPTDAETMIMWGQPVMINSFETLAP